MSDQSSMHAYRNWAIQRLDEMEAVLASIEAEAGHMTSAVKAQAGELIARLRKRRDEFRDTVRQQSEMGGAALLRTKSQLDSQWDSFEAEINTYFASVGKQIERQQTTFRNVAAAQANAWRKAADSLHDEAAKIVAARRSEIDATVKQMKADAAQTEARLQELAKAGTQSWAALSAALSNTRNAFDRANREAWDAFKRAASPPN